MSEDNKEKKADVSLSDESRVKVMSPGMMVYKRFIRNKLAIAGLIILAFMFLFSFAGGFFYPYSESQVFKSTGSISLDYAAVSVNSDLRYYLADGADFPQMARAEFLLALGKGEDSFMHGDVEYTIEGSDDYYKIGGSVSLAEADVLPGRILWKESDAIDMTAELKAAFEEAYNAEQDSFEFEGVEYSILRATRWCAIAAYQDFAIASLLSFDTYDPANEGTVGGYAFRMATEDAIAAGQASFEYGGRSFTLDMLDNQNGTVFDDSGAPYADISIYIISPPADSGITLPIGLKKDIREALVQHQTFFNSDAGETGADARYDIHPVSPQTYMVKTQQATEVIEIYYPPSGEHVLGTDANGMDILARLIYGGRISLTVGFVVIVLELLIGVVFGGISGYFGGWVDTLMMRFVDLFNTIPTYPMLIILGSIMDAYRVDPIYRIYLLMLILGLLGWTAIARTVRGQILTLREQEFMIAAEASGLSIPRRIFRHLVPNIMPLLIVNATMGLGTIIITEATLSFLGLGVKYPLASWGTMSNAATSETVMSFYPWAWLPAGILIFITVLGFNFVGDGLRDAFDPKMKR